MEIAGGGGDGGGNIFATATSSLAWKSVLGVFRGDAFVSDVGVVVVLALFSAGRSFGG